MQQQKERVRLEVQEGWKQSVTKRDVAIAIGITLVLIGGVGAWVSTHGAAPAVPYQVAGAFLIFVWAATLSGWVQLRRRRLWHWRNHIQQGFFLVAYSLFLLPMVGAVPKNHWIGNIGVFLIFLHFVGSMIGWKKATKS